MPKDAAIFGIQGQQITGGIGSKKHATGSRQNARMRPAFVFGPAPANFSGREVESNQKTFRPKGAGCAALMPFDLLVRIQIQIIERETALRVHIEKLGLGIETGRHPVGRASRIAFYE